MIKQFLGRSIVIPSLATALLSLGVMSNAHAVAMGTASSYIDWSTISITTDSGMSVALDLTYSANEATTDATNSAAEYQSSSVYNLDGSPAQSSSSVTGSSASASANDAGIFTQSSSNGMNLLGTAVSSAYASRDAELSVTGSGMITISVAYVMSAFTVAEQLFEEASAYADAILSGENVVSGELQEDIQTTQAYAFNGSSDGSTSPITGLLSISMMANDGDFFYIFTDVYTTAYNSTNTLPVAVPAPASILLVLAGLFGVGLRRKQAA